MAVSFPATRPARRARQNFSREPQARPEEGGAGVDGLSRPPALLRLVLRDVPDRLHDDLRVAGAQGRRYSRWEGLWTFAGGTPSTSAVTNPTITYNTAGSYSVQLVVTNANGTNSYTIASYINVVSPASLPLVQDFQSATFAPANWYVNDVGNYNVKWKLSTTAGYNSTQSTVFDNYNDSVLYRDELKTLLQ